MSSFVGLYTGLSGIRAAQTGIDVTSNNVANANTPGYTRQRLELRPSAPYDSLIGKMGTGVTVDSIARLRDTFLDDRYRAAIGDGVANAVRAEFMQSLESLSGEPEQGISQRLDNLWPALEAWANDPNDAAARRQVLGELASVAEGFNLQADTWDSLAADYEERRETTATSANQILGNLYELNLRMAGAQPDRQDPQLFDQRDLLLDQLAELTGATSRIQPDGSVTVRLGDVNLLEHPDEPLELAIDPDDGSITAGDEVVTFAVSGELGGLHRSLTIDLPQWREGLNDLAATLAEAFNRVNGEGLRADGSPGGDLFTYDADGAAGSLRLAVTGIGALAAGPSDGPNPPAVHDGTNARAFAALRTTRLNTDGEVDPAAGRTLENRVADNIVGLAGSVRTARASAEASSAVATSATLARAAEHGVSLDEEMVSLVRYQRALEAAARVMTTVDQALDVLVNRVGIVGR